MASPVMAARSRPRRPCPVKISTGNATAPPRKTTVPSAVTAAGQCVPASTSVYQGTPNSSARIVVIVRPKISGRTSERRAGAAGAATLSDTAGSSIRFGFAA
jgi:hypothetical protein